MRNVLKYLENAAQRVPDKTAYSDGTHALTFAQTQRYARAIGSYLARAGHNRIPVVVLMTRSPDMIAAFFGVVYAGCAYVPVDPEMSRSRIEGIFDDLTKPAVVICDDTTRSLAGELSGGDILVFKELINTEPDDNLLGRIREDAIDTDLLYIVYTSGSTGKPKGVAANHRSVIDYIEALSYVLDVNEDTVFGNQTPLYVDACLKELYPTLRSGATAYLIPKELFMSPIKLLDFLNENKINTICWVVSALTILSGTGALEKNPPRFLRTVAFGSELFPQAQLARWRKTLPNARFINMYGPTECTGMSCYYEVTRDFSPGEPIPIGRPFPNTRILLLDGDTQVTEPGIDGEICILGTSLTLGYYNDPVKTDQSFVQNPLNKSYRELMYRTGDIGRYNESGELVFASRLDHQIKHMGHRIELGELESVITAHEGVIRAACLFDNEKKKIILFYTGAAETAEAMAYMKQRLPRYSCPNAVIKLETLPLTTNGKIDRTALMEFYKTR